MIEIDLKILVVPFVVVVISFIAYFCKRMIDQTDKNFDKISGRFDKVDNALVEVRKDFYVQEASIAVLNEKIDNIEEHCPLMGKVP